MNLLKRMFYTEQSNTEIKETSIISQIFEKKQSTQEVIEEIHNSFETASLRLLEEAKNIIANKIPSEHHEKIAKLGFTQAKGVKENENLKKEREEQEKIALKLEYYNQKYPFKKFITEKEVEKICNKYNLVFGNCSQYLGEIPKKNIEEISNFVQPNKEDLCYKRVSWRSSMNHNITYVQYTQGRTDRDFGDVSYTVNTKFNICAPISDMDTRGYKKEGYKLVKEVPDPIVLFPVQDDMYIIVSKWGLEANDKLLTNSIEN